MREDEEWDLEVEDDGDELSEEELRQERLNALGLTLSETRADCIAAREESGIEEEWLEDEEYYEGIDDVNRADMAAWGRSKPLGQAAIKTDSDDGETGSKIFFNITSAYCDAASARVADMLIPTDDRAWSIDPTPIPEMEPISKGEFPTDLREAIRAEFDSDEEAEAKMGELQKQMATQVEQAKELAQRAQTRIDDWHVEGQYHAEVRLVIEETSKIGSGVLKGPFTRKKRAIAYIDEKLQVDEKLIPISKCISPWNLYPARGCGESIHNGDHIWECDEITAKGLRSLKGVEGYIDSAIDNVIKEGPMQAVKDWEVGNNKVASQIGLQDKKGSLYQIWYMHGTITKDDLMDAGYEFDEGEFEEMEDSIDGKVTMVNNIVIGIDLNPLDTGEFPYDIMTWQRRVGLPWGKGVARQIRTPQRVVNEAARHMMDNAGHAAGPQQVTLEDLVPENGRHEMKPWKQWRIDGDLDPKEVQYALQFIYAEMQQGPLQAIIELGLRMAEDVTGLPMIMQGQTNQRTPNTLGGMQIQNNNASTVLRRIARAYDDKLTEPHVRRYYAYLLQYGDDKEKGEFVIDARGSSALVERDLEVQSIMEFYQVVTNPVFGKDPRKWADEAFKSKRLDPKRFDYDDDKWRETVERLSQPPADPRVEVAQMKMESEERDREVDMAKLEIETLIAQMKEDNLDARQVRELKTKLSDTVMRLTTQKQLSGVKTVQAIEPAAEPAGRAKNGEAFVA